MVAVTPIRRRPRVAEAAALGRQVLLVALRDRIAGELDVGVPARDLASLSRRLLDIAESLELLGEAADGIAAAAAIPDEAW